MSTKKRGKEATGDQATEQMRETAAPETMAAEEKTITSVAAGEASTEFLYLPLTGIEVLSQVRSAVNEESESFKALVQSVKDQGILEPLIVCPDGATNYRLLCGERRLLAARKAGIESVPVRIVNATEQDQFITLQLTENIQREDLNPIDQARGILSYFQAKHPDKNYEVDGVTRELLNQKLKPEYVSDQISPTIGEIMEITGKSINTLCNVLSLLKLSDTIKTAVSDGTLPVSQGYLFAANLDCPESSVIFNAVMKKPVTNAVLTKLLTAWKKAKPDSTRPKSLTQQIKSISVTKTAIVESGKVYKQADLQKLLDTLKDFVAKIELRLQPSP